MVVARQPSDLLFTSTRASCGSQVPFARWAANACDFATSSVLNNSESKHFTLLTFLGQRLMLVIMMLTRTRTHLHQPWRLD